MYMFPAADRVTGHARGCAREQACPKLQSMWTRKYGFPFPYMLSCLWDNAYKRTLAANRIEGYYQLLTICPRQTTQFITGMCAHDSHVL